jgi:hypothetical protein
MLLSLRILHELNVENPKLFVTNMSGKNEPGATVLRTGPQINTFLMSYVMRKIIPADMSSGCYRT